MKLLLKPSPNPKYLWLCIENGNFGDAEATATYGIDAKILTIDPEAFDGPMSVTTHPVIVTSLRIISATLTPAEGNWQAVRDFLETVESAETLATEMGYNLEDLMP